MILLTLAGYYLLMGCVFALGFFWRGHAAIAPEARGASWVVKLMWTPAAIVLWPLLTAKWLRARNRPE